MFKNSGEYMNHKLLLEQISVHLAKNSLENKRIKINPEKPFQWASGYFMPIYNDNRQIMILPLEREYVKEAFQAMIYQYGEKDLELIAGTATAGISPATTLADSIKAPLIYVRDKPKNHGLKNRIEGVSENSDLGELKVLLIEDNISTGGSSVDAIQAIREANGIVNSCFAIFDYGFDISSDMFEGKIPYNNNGDKLKIACNKRAILTYDKLIDVALDTGYIKKEHIKILEEWRSDPFSWGERRGFSRIVK
jgi:orotate phosphoribosyltransferase